MTYCLIVFLGLVAYSDIRYRRIHNGLLIAGLVTCALLFAYADVTESSSGLQIDWWAAAFGFIAGLLLFYPLWRLRLLGAGDVKLLAVLGFMFGWNGLWQVFLIACMTAGVHSLLLICCKHQLPIISFWFTRSVQRGIPFGAHLALAALLWAFYFRQNLPFG